MTSPTHTGLSAIVCMCICVSACVCVSECVCARKALGGVGPVTHRCVSDRVYLCV